MQTTQTTRAIKYLGAKQSIPGLVSMLNKGITTVADLVDNGIEFSSVIVQEFKPKNSEPFTSYHMIVAPDPLGNGLLLRLSNAVVTLYKAKGADFKLPRNLQIVHSPGNTQYRENVRLGMPGKQFENISEVGRNYDDLVGDGTSALDGKAETEFTRK